MITTSKKTFLMATKEMPRVYIPKTEHQTTQEPEGKDFLCQYCALQLVLW